MSNTVAGATTPVVLVWGAAPSDSRTMFSANGCRGPRAGPLRKALLSKLVSDFRRRKVAAEAHFSETWFHGNHRPENAGLYEPEQLELATLVILLFPGNRPLAVNTWETALACEADDLGEPRHRGKPIFVVPASIHGYLRSVFSAGVDDPIRYRPGAVAEPSLGPQTSFAARWVYLFMMSLLQNVRAYDVRKFDSFPLVPYDDTCSWTLKSKEFQRLMITVLQRVAQHIS